ncbi:MAG: di-heme oxidoredictase family protein [Gemmatimonadota bacterium]|jgi:CxxC motif-containing protein (DUF1111 family)
MIPRTYWICAAVLLAACKPSVEPTVTAEPGEPLPGLTEAERGRFLFGKGVFERLVTPEEGLGPLYNAVRCSECHEVPATGGAGFRVRVVKATKYENGSCDLLVNEGGDNIQQRATAALAALGITREHIPADANGTAHVTAPALFGVGLVEAIPEATVLANADPDDADGDGISGRAARTADGRLGRFGRKAEQPTALEFIDTALRFELGLTTPMNPHEEMPDGVELPAGVDPLPEPEIDAHGIDLLTDYVHFLAPPARELAHGAVKDSIDEGSLTFVEIGCAKCHTPTMHTGDNEVAALDRKTAHLYSDMLLHDMGPELADVCGPDAAPAEYLTTRLWGLRYRGQYMHDGRTARIEDAIEAHGGESAASRDAWRALTADRRAMLLRFLRSL